jgi:hypothetical protein
MIFRLIHIIPDASCSTQNKAGAWVRAVPYPPLKGSLRARLRDAWAVFWRDDVLAVAWPFSGEFEQAMARRDEPGSWGRDRKPAPTKPRLPESVT